MEPVPTPTYWQDLFTNPAKSPFHVITVPPVPPQPTPSFPSRRQIERVRADAEHAARQLSFYAAPGAGCAARIAASDTNTNRHNSGAALHAAADDGDYEEGATETDGNGLAFALASMWTVVRDLCSPMLAYAAAVLAVLKTSTLDLLARCDEAAACFLDHASRLLWEARLRMVGVLLSLLAARYWMAPSRHVVVLYHDCHMWYVGPR